MPEKNARNAKRYAPPWLGIPGIHGITHLVMNHENPNPQNPAAANRAGDEMTEPKDIPNEEPKATVICGNWSWREPELQDGDVVTGGNFSQERPGTVICKDVKDLTILGGNFTNCVAQPTWIVKGGNWNQVDFEAMDAVAAAVKATVAAAVEQDRATVASALATAEAGLTAVVKDGQIVVVRTGEVPK